MPILVPINQKHAPVCQPALFSWKGFALRGGHRIRIKNVQMGKMDMNVRDESNRCIQNQQKRRMRRTDWLFWLKTSRNYDKMKTAGRFVLAGFDYKETGMNSYLERHFPMWFDSL